MSTSPPGAWSTMPERLCEPAPGTGVWPPRIGLYPGGGSPHGDCALLGSLELHGQCSRIVGEVAPPVLVDRSGHELLAYLDRLHRIVVEGARPADWQLPARRDEVSEEHGTGGSGVR